MPCANSDIISVVASCYFLHCVLYGSGGRPKKSRRDDLRGFLLHIYTISPALLLQLSGGFFSAPGQKLRV
ncbi:hypothetical protein F4810DRAFT_655282 [Camillea tinctor]|nr:hypothetical protein F4810DRAFT_655282 [Camillea tinctor]